MWAFAPSLPKSTAQTWLGSVFIQIIHRDLAARNVLVREKCNKVEVKISDFGMARQLVDIDVYYAKDKVGVTFIIHLGTSKNA